jgi:hypothetical protein
VTFNHKNGEFCKSSPVDEYHLPQMNSEKYFLGVDGNLTIWMIHIAQHIDLRDR